MTRWLPAVALGGLLALVAIAAVLALRADPDSPTARAEALAAELRCPDCQGLSVADSPTDSAQEIRRQIAELVAEGDSDGAVRDHFVARYGEWILLAPSAPWVWVVPFAVVAVAAAALAAWLARRGRPSQPPATPHLALTDDERQRLHDEAEALDA